jgi:putative flippase GtrA
MSTYLWRFLRFNGISSSGLLLTTGLLNVQVFLFHMNVYLSNLIAIVLVSVWNYGWSTRVGWRVKRARPADGT